MELSELRYFLAVADTGGVHAGARRLRVSAGSLSKAVAKLEDELGLRLFARAGRGITLTEHGRLLQQRARRLVVLEERTRRELAGAVELAIVGTEVALAYAGLELARRIGEHTPRAAFELRPTRTEDHALRDVLTGNAHVAVLTFAPEVGGGVTRDVGASSFVTCVGPGHPLHLRAARGEAIPIAEVLEHDFVAPLGSLFGRVSADGSPDGWRDDLFPRRIRYRVKGLRLLEGVVAGGRAVAYLPAHQAGALGLARLRVEGCPFHCEQRSFLFMRDEDHPLASVVAGARPMFPIGARSAKK